jgi:uncharacterized protein
MAPRGVVLLLHGFKGFKDWGFFPWLAEALTGAGFATLTPNFSLNGVGGTGDVFRDLEGFARNTFSREQEEVALLVKAVRVGEILPNPPEWLGLFGHSRGGGQAILAAERHGADALVTWASVASFHRWTPEEKAEWRTAGRIHVMNQRTGQALPLDRTLLEDLETHAAQLDIKAASGALTAPWLIVHGTGDPVVLMADAHGLAAQSPGARTLFLDGAGHTLGATHPLADIPDPLKQAADATVAHFIGHCGGGAGVP